MTICVLPIDPATYRPHPLHAGDADWRETNCTTDMWIEILHSCGLDPIAGLAFTVGTDFDGEQWTMFTYPEEDLRVLYGIEVHELNIWRPVLEHVVNHLRLGHLVAMDVDAYFLPDTAGVTYQVDHQKTTITAQSVDLSGRRLGYFHNGGYAELAGSDFDGIFCSGGCPSPATAVMPPFASTIRIDGIRRASAADMLESALARLGTHLSRRPADNPVSRLAKRVCEDLPAIRLDGLASFHRYAFGTFRHLGANGELAAAFVEWLVEHDPAAAGGQLRQALEAYRRVSTGAKAAEFMLARSVAGRSADLSPVFIPLEDAWERAGAVLDDLYGARTPAPR